MKTAKLRQIDFGAVARKYLAAKIPFCWIRFPNEAKPEFYFRPERKRADADHYLAISGWNAAKPTYYYKPYSSDIEESSKSESSISFPKRAEATPFETYASQFKKYQKAFTEGHLKKVILSRIKNVEITKSFDPIAYYGRLEKAYPNALVYIVLHPEEGIWVGATPEILLRYASNTYHTVSLAATQATGKTPYRWTQKEVEEHALVSTHIREQLKASKALNLKESAPESVEAGSVAHLCSTFQFNTQSAPADFNDIIHRLHPTPAIGGLPVAGAVEIIDKTEDHDRRLYTGIIGRKKSNKIDYYVNLRCMQIFPKSLSLYLGGGITAGSTVQSEWDETEKKGKTLLNWIDYGA